MGHLFSDNEERGVFKTTNGGKTWEKVLYVNDRVGVIDLAHAPGASRDPLCRGLTTRSGSPGSTTRAALRRGIYKTTDAGKTWTKLGGGLPAGTNRPDRDRYLSQESRRSLYALIDNANKRPATKKEIEQDQSRGPRSPGTGHAAARSTGRTTAVRPGER